MVAVLTPFATAVVAAGGTYGGREKPIDHVIDTDKTRLLVLELAHSLPPLPFICKLAFGIHAVFSNYK